jgi:hypothetical protein
MDFFAMRISTQFNMQIRYVARVIGASESLTMQVCFTMANILAIDMREN